MIDTSAVQEMEMVASSHHVGGPRFWPLLGCARHAQTGPSAVKVGVCYISRTRSWVKPTIWLPSPPMGLTINTGAQLQGEPRTACYALAITFCTEVVLKLCYEAVVRKKMEKCEEVKCEE